MEIKKQMKFDAVSIIGGLLNKNKTQTIRLKKRKTPKYSVGDMVEIIWDNPRIQIDGDNLLGMIEITEVFEVRLSAKKYISGFLDGFINSKRYDVCSHPDTFAQEDGFMTFDDLIEWAEAKYKISKKEKTFFVYRWRWL